MPLCAIVLHLFFKVVLDGFDISLRYITYGYMVILAIDKIMGM